MQSSSLSYSDMLNQIMSGSAMLSDMAMPALFLFFGILLDWNTIKSSNKTYVQNAENQLQTLMRTDESDFESLYRSLTSAARTALVSTITEGQLGDAISNIQQIVAYNTRTDLWYNVGGGNAP